MTVPAAMDLYSAAESFKQVPKWVLDDELKELRSALPQVMREMFPQGYGNDFESGYLLGLQVARVMIKGMPKAVEAGVDL